MDDGEPLDLREDPGWVLSVNAVGLSLQEADIRLFGITYVIARIPGDFPYIGNTNLQMATVLGDPELIVIFEQDPWEPLIHLIGVELGEGVSSQLPWWPNS